MDKQNDLEFEGEILKEWIKNKGFSARSLAKKINRSNNYFPSVYRKKRLSDVDIRDISEAVDQDIRIALNIRTETDLTPIVSEPKEIYKSSKNRRHRIVIDFLNGDIDKISRANLNTLHREESKIDILEQKLEEILEKLEK